MIKIFEMGKIRDEEIFARFEPTSSVEDIVKGIIARVRAEGDAALRAYSAEFDHVEIEDFLVSETEIEAALAKVEPGFIAVLEEAAANIRAFHSKQVRNSFIMADKPGVILGQRVIPLEKVGLYVPGGTAAYPSTVLMDAIPAKIAGVEEIVMVTPPEQGGLGQSVYPGGGACRRCGPDLQGRRRTGGGGTCVWHGVDSTRR